MNDTVITNQLTFYLHQENQNVLIGRKVCPDLSLKTFLSLECFWDVQLIQMKLHLYIFSRIGRHSKSLDTQRFVCALCTGQLVLLTPSSSRGPTPFATFVKENYGAVRQELAGQGHAEVMRKLSADFASKTRLSQS